MRACRPPAGAARILVIEKGRSDPGGRFFARRFIAVDATYRVDINYHPAFDIFNSCLPIPSPQHYLCRRRLTVHNRGEIITLQWDHAVQFVNQPEAAIQTLPTSSCGRWPVGGIRVGNPQCAELFGLTYIEFLAISDPDELRAATDKFLLSRDAARLLPENEALFRWRCARRHRRHHDQLRRTG